MPGNKDVHKKRDWKEIWKTIGNTLLAFKYHILIGVICIAGIISIERKTIAHDWGPYKYHLLFGLGCMGLFITITLAYLKIVKNYGDKMVNTWGWHVFNALAVLVGTSVSYKQKITIIGITFPHILVAPVLVVLIMIVARILISVTSFPLTKVLLPNSVNQAGENRVIDNAADAKQYYEAMASVLQKMAEDGFRNDLAVLRIDTKTDAAFISQILEFINYFYRDELEKFDLTAEMVAGTTINMQDQDQVGAPDYATFFQISMAAKENKQGFWDHGTAEPFAIWGEPYLLAIYSADVIPRNLLRSYVATWSYLCELPYVKSIEEAKKRAKEINVVTQEQIDEYMGRTS